jgi:phage baseplate assembly protein W
MASSTLYNKIVIKNNLISQKTPRSKTYNGFSTLSPDSNNFSVYDYALIKQDIINHFHIRQGELVENPTFGTIIWDVIFEPFTEQLKQLIVDDVRYIINYDPRVNAREVVVTQSDYGLIIDCTLEYLTYNIVEKLQLRFDENNKIMI